MSSYADLEIGVYRRGRKSCNVELRFSADDHLETRGPLTVGLDLEKLREQMYDVKAYGELLTGSLFGARGDRGIRHAFQQARTHAQRDDLPLRIRLRIGPDAPELHGVWWETLRDPEDGTPLLTDENVLFSRYLSSLDWRPVGVRSGSQLRALLVIANPSDLAEYEAEGRALPPIDVAGERERVERAMAGVPVTVLASGGAAILEGMIGELRAGHHILYVVCHGYFGDGEPQVLLEDSAGQAHRVSGDDLIDALRDLQRPPRLVVLASCQSAGAGGEAASGDHGALAALGPRMAEAGIPAVLAMQDSVSMQTVAQFMPVFFRELKQTGQIDRAMAVARGAVRQRHDWWVPVLFMRLESGRLWYAPGFAGDRQDFEKWPALLTYIQRGRCTPVIGLGVTDGSIGSPREIAEGWASQYRYFPMAPHHREDLPHVAQFLAVNLGSHFPLNELEDYVRRQLLKRYRAHLPAGAGDWQLDELIEAVGKHRRSVDPLEPHAILARLPFRIFITTHLTSLLTAALTAEGKKPQVELCRWKDEGDWPESVFDDLASQYEQSLQRPLVYHLFGHLAHPDTLVITEDDYFDYLIGVTRNRELIPETVRRAFADSALLFLGFRLDEWDFRVLFRSIARQQGEQRRNKYLHVAVQIDPEESRTINPDRARQYLESYFSQQDQIRVSIYWGSVEDFVAELNVRWARRLEGSG